MRAVQRRGLSLWILLSVVVAIPVAAGGDVNVFLGKKRSSDNTLEEAEVDSPAQYGVAVSLDFDWPVVLAVDLMTSSDDATLTDSEPGVTRRLNTEVDTLELDVGVRKYFMERIRPYVGGGLAWASLDGKFTGTIDLDPGPPPTPFDVVDDSDSGFGYWLNGGFVYGLGHFNVGVDLRYSDVSAKLTAAELTPGEAPPTLSLDAGGIQAGILLGYHW